MIKHIQIKDYKCLHICELGDKAFYNCNGC